MKRGVRKVASAKKKVLRTSDLARFLSVSPDEISYWARKGKIPAYKEGRQWRFKRSDIKKWVKKREPSLSVMNL